MEQGKREREEGGEMERGKERGREGERRKMEGEDGGGEEGGVRREGESLK